MSQEDDALNRMHEAEEHVQRVENMRERLTVMAQLLTCALERLGGEMAVTTTEIERSVMGQQLALTPLPNSRGYYVALVTHTLGGPDAGSLATPVDVRPGDPRRT